MLQLHRCSASADGFILQLKIALWVGLIVGAPVWLYQLWAFIAPGLHRHERKWAYVFVGASPRRCSPAARCWPTSWSGTGLEFLLEAGVIGETTELEVTAYVDFVTSMILLFGVAFEFPLILLMLNFTGVVSARRLLSWWRVVGLPVVRVRRDRHPDPGPFGMTLLAAVHGAALLHRGRRRASSTTGARAAARRSTPAWTTTRSSPLEDDRRAGRRAGDRRSTRPTPVERRRRRSSRRPLPLESRYDDMT